MPRLTLASVLCYRGARTEARAELERLWNVAEKYLRPHRLDLLPGVSLLIQVNQAERAARLAAEYVADLEPAGPSGVLANALRYLANANTALRQWPEARAALVRCVEVEEACGDFVSATGKRVEMALDDLSEQLLKKQPISPGLEASIEGTFGEAERRLQGLTTREAEVIRMFMHQGRARLANALGRWETVLESLDAAAAVAMRLGSYIHVADALAHAGLLLHSRGGHGDRPGAVAAQQHFDGALEMRRSLGAPDGVANAAYLAAANERVLAHLAPARDERSAHLSRAAALLREADRAIAALLLTYEEPGTEGTDAACVAMHAPWKKVYSLAMDVFAVDLSDDVTAFEWSERWRGRALAMSLGALDPTLPRDLPADLLEEERLAREALRHAHSFADIVRARQELAGVWDRLATFPSAAEYVALRSGNAITYQELSALLRDHSQSPMSTNGAQ